MRRRDFLAAAAGALALPATSLPNKPMAAAGTKPEIVKMRPADNGKALVNPNMGYTMHFYSNRTDKYGSELAPSDALEDFPGESTVYLRIPWAFVEPEEGKFNWSVLDTPAQRWIDAGKYCSFRITCFESWMRYATPEWVKDAGTRGHVIKKRTAPRPPFAGDLWEPIYDDPVFLEKLENFIRAMAARYDGNPNVAFIDIGSYGMWGEGHTVHTTKMEYGLDAIKKHIDMHCKYFKNTLLCLSDDADGPSNTSGDYPILDYALSQGVTMRDDSIQSQPPPRAWFHADMAQRFWPTLPVILEHAHYGKPRSRGDWGKGEVLMQAIEEYHASYLSIHWWPDKYLDDNRALIDRVNRRLGYRIQLREITYPKQVRIGEPFKIQTFWANAGVAPCHNGGYPCFTIKDDRGGIVSTHVDAALNVKDLKVAAPGKAKAASLESELTIAMGFSNGFDKPQFFSMAAAPGRYQLYVSIGALDGTPVLRLPYDGDDGHKRYKIGQIEVGERSA